MQAWNPERSLRQVSTVEARFSRGFLTAAPQLWFAHLAELWMPLFHSLSADVRFRGFEKGFSIPPEVTRVRFVEIDGEPATIGMDVETVETIAREIVPGCQKGAAAIVIEYIERRLLATIQRSWVGSQPLVCQYLSQERDYEFELAGTVAIHLEISGIPCTVWLGFGLRLLERLDAEARLRIVAKARGKNPTAFSDHIHTVSLELVELAVPPALLIDYMRSGSQIDLQIPLGDRVFIRVDDEIWGEGRLCQFNGSFAAEVSVTSVPSRTFPEATTRVRVELAATELDSDSLLEHAQPGAILLTEAPLVPQASLIISGENVAEASVGSIDGQFFITVLPK